MTSKFIFRFLLLPVVCSCVTVAAGLLPGSGLKVVAPRCEYLVNPLCVDEKQPRLSWRVESSSRGQRQTAYQVIVASTQAALKKEQGDLWDSGKVESDQTSGVAYAGKSLTSRQEAWWAVKVLDADHKAGRWSKPAHWRMGLLDRGDWRAQYISFRDTTPLHKDRDSLYLPAARQYRKEFSASRPVKKATIYATALGIYELHLNGRRVGDAYFAPGWTDYHQRAYYRAYDVTRQVKEGPNALGAWVADGWYSGYIGFGLLTSIGTEKIGRYTYGKTPAVMAQLEIEYEDGSREMVVTDNSWKVSGNGPIQQADFLMGEFYDARKEMSGWSTPGFDASAWEPAILASENPPVTAMFYEGQNPPPGQKLQDKGREVQLGFRAPPKLEAFPGVPVRPTQEIKPVEITTPTNGVYIFDLGQNFAGVVRLKVKGPAGTQIQLRYGEMLHPDGRLMTENLRKARATDFYVLRGDPKGEVYTPRFTFHGFQYVELTGLTEKPRLEDLTGIVLHSDTPFTSAFECSDPTANRLFKNIVWTQRANFLDLPTDCPQRDERFGWTGDAQIYVRAATYNADVASFYTKWLRELMESQRPSGTFPGYAPYPFQHGWDFGTAWCDAGVICPWTIYRAYNDTRIIERCWEPMTRFIEWRKNTSKNFLGVVHGNNWGDWLSINEKTPLDYIDTVYFAYSTRLMAEMGEAIGKRAEAAEYHDLFKKIKAAFQGKYLNPDGTLKVDTQTAYALALFMDLVPANLRTAAGAELARKIKANDTCMTTGFLGTRPLLPVLSSVGQHDLAVRLFQSHKFPSWGYEVDQGATTIWERWNSYTKDKGFGGAQNASMNSFAHYSFGAVCEWMFFQLAGIDSAGPGYKHLVIQPSPPSPNSNPDRPPIDWVKAHYDSINGRIAVEWKRQPHRFLLELAVPANTVATLYLPARAESAFPALKDIREGGRELAKSKGVKLIAIKGDRAIIEVQSGRYEFESAL